MRIGITGHQDIPEEARAYLTTGIQQVLEAIRGHLVGVSSLAAGADQLFASLVIEHGGELEVILPSTNYAETFPQTEHLENFQALLARAAKVEKLDFNEPSEDAFLAAGRKVVDLSD